MAVSSVLVELRKVGKAAGLDNIPSRLLKDSSLIIAKHLARIINCLTTTEEGAVRLDKRLVLLFKVAPYSFREFVDCKFLHEYSASEFQSRWLK